MSQIGSSSPNRGENKKSLKPPPRVVFNGNYKVNVGIHIPFVPLVASWVGGHIFIHQLRRMRSEKGRMDRWHQSVQKMSTKSNLEPQGQPFISMDGNGDFQAFSI